jgi:hypothetical protein
MLNKRSRPAKTCLFGLGVAALLHGGAAYAVLIDFEDVVIAGTNPIVISTNSRGFNFASGHHHEINNPAFSGVASNGTQYILEEGASLGQPITMTQIGGGTFSLTSFDGAEVWVVNNASFPNATVLNVLGNVSGGGVVNTSFNLDGIIDGAGGAADFQTFFLPGTFTNLVSVVFSGSIVGGSTNAGISIDNLNSDGQTVPEPASLALLLGALAAASWSRRRRA